MTASTAKPCELVAPTVESSIPNASVTSATHRKADERIMLVSPGARGICLQGMEVGA